MGLKKLNLKEFLVPKCIKMHLKLQNLKCAACYITKYVGYILVINS